MIFSYFFPENKIWHFMQIVSNWDNLRDMPNRFLKNKIRKNITNLPFIEESGKG